MTNEKIDIGNVRGIQGERGEKGEIGRTPTYEQIKYQRENDEFIAIIGNGLPKPCYVDVNGNFCDSEGHLLDEEGNPTSTIGTPFDETETGYLYKPVYVDNDWNLVNQYNERVDELGNVLYVETSFLKDILSTLYSDENGYNKLVTDIYPHVTDTLVNAAKENPIPEKYHAFFSEIEGDIKYYICKDNPSRTIYIDEISQELVNNCRYLDVNGSIVKNEDNTEAHVPLEKNTVYLYQSSDSVDNEIMHYDIYLCTKYNTIPILLVSSADFKINYNVVDELHIEPTTTPNVAEDEQDVFLQLYTRGTRGQFYSMNDVDTLFMNNVINRLGTSNGIAQLNGSGKVPSSQLPSFIDDVIEGTMKNDETVFTPSNNDYIDSVKQTGTIYVDTSTRKSYRWTGSTYVLIANPVIVDDGSTTAYSHDKGWVLENLIGDIPLETENSTIIGSINLHEIAINDLDSNKVNKDGNKVLSDVNFSTAYETKLKNIETEATKTIIDSSLDATSTNPIQNKVIKSALDNKINKSDIVDDLNTNDSTKPLSAKQGKALCDMIGNAISYINQ